MTLRMEDKPEEQEIQTYELAIASGGSQQELAPLSPTAIKAQVQLIQVVMRDVMKEGTHFGVIPGTGKKKTLLKPGAEKLGMTFRFAPSYKIAKTDLGNGHREYEITCILKQIGTDLVLGEGVGCCSTMESKYRWRNKKKTCPSCGEESIMASQYDPGWYCNPKSGGCKAKFKEDDLRIAKQETGRFENEDIADVYNTVLKMGKKRAHIDATISVTAASDIFDQDIDETHVAEALGVKPQKENEDTSSTVQATQTASAPAPEQKQAPEPKPGQSEPQMTKMIPNPGKTYQGTIHTIRYQEGTKRNFGVISFTTEAGRDKDGNVKPGITPDLFIFKRPRDLKLFPTDEWNLLVGKEALFSITMSEKDDKTWFQLESMNLVGHNVVDGYDSYIHEIELSLINRSESQNLPPPEEGEAEKIFETYIHNVEFFKKYYGPGEEAAPVFFAQLTNDDMALIDEQLADGKILEWYNDYITQV